MNYFDRSVQGSFLLRNIIISTLVGLFFWAFSSTVQAQTKNVSYTNQQWVHYNNQIKFSQKWTLLTDAGNRFRDKFAHQSQYIVRTAIGYQVDPNVKVALGFAHLGFYSNDKLSRLEYRPFQEISLKQKYKNAEGGHRLRVEERYIRSTGTENGPVTYDFSFRFRYRYLFTFPLVSLSSTHPDKKLLFNVGDEIFINAGKKIVYNVFDQNRVLIGPTLKVNNHLAFNLLYNHQFSASNAPGRYRQDYILWLGINHTIDVSKTQK